MKTILFYYLYLFIYIYYLLPEEFRNVTQVSAWHFSLQSAIDKIKARLPDMYIGCIKETLTGSLKLEKTRHCHLPVSPRLERGMYLNGGMLSDPGDMMLEKFIVGRLYQSQSPQITH